MIGYAPNIYSDEIYCSILSRYHKKSGNNNIKQTVNDLYSFESNKVNSIDLPTGIGCVVDKLYVGKKIEYFIEKHTMYPVMFPFMDNDMKEELLILIKTKDLKNIKKKVLLKCRHAKHKLKYCPVCANADFNDYGEAYFHRIHQVPSINICPTHMCVLYEYEHDKNKTFSYVCLEVVQVEKLSDSSVVANYNWSSSV